MQPPTRRAAATASILIEQHQRIAKERKKTKAANRAAKKARKKSRKK